MAEHEANELSDILENLENLEQGLMAYEDALHRDEEDSSLIHMVFRYAHNLKSALAMIHKQGSSELIHAVESEFDLIRSGKAIATSDVIDASFTAIDLIKENLYQEIESDDELQALQREFEKLQEETRSEGAAKLTFDMPSATREKLKQAEKDGYSIYQIEKLIKSDIEQESFSNLPIYIDIEEVGFHIITHPPFEQINRNSEEAVLKILFASKKSQDDLFYDIFDPFQPVDTDTISETTTEQRQKPSSQQTAAIEKKKKQMRAPTKKAGELDILLVEDDFVTRHLESKLLSEYGTCETAVNGSEAVLAFEHRMRQKNPYDVIFLDILIPELDGHGVLDRIRESEEEHDIIGFERTKVVIVSNLQDMETITRSFRNQSDSYIVKPVTKAKIQREMKRLGFVS